jgi:hypothetical protein
MVRLDIIPLYDKFTREERWVFSSVFLQKKRIQYIIKNVTKGVLRSHHPEWSCTELSGAGKLRFTIITQNNSRKGRCMIL